MTTEQIYTLVNAVNQQAFGSSAVAVADLQGLISLGNTVLSSSTNTEAFLNTLAQRIGNTIIRFRRYRNKLSDMVLTDFEYGAILQKLYVHMPTAEEDPMYDLTNGQSVDMYTVNKPVVDQKLFVTRTPYMFFVTIQRQTLKDAFLSESGMGALISSIYGQVRNKIEATLENLGRLNIAAGIAEAGAGQEVKLITEYNAASGQTVTAAGALLDEGFLRYAIRRIKETMDDFTDNSVMHNDGSLETFTPYEDQRIRIISKFERALETCVEWAAFNEEYVKLAGYSKLNFWQGEQSPYKIHVERPSDGTEVEKDNIICVIHDRDALGIYQEYEEILTSPINAKGNYFNQYWHRKDARMLDCSENFVYFTLS
jgi:hypothetical protein